MPPIHQRALSLRVNLIIVPLLLSPEPQNGSELTQEMKTALSWQSRSSLRGLLLNYFIFCFLNNSNIEI